MSTVSHFPVVKRARDSKIKEPITKKEKKLQDQLQAEEADKLLDQKERERAENRRLAQEQGGVARAESDAFGVLSGRAAEIPVVDEDGRKRHLDVDEIREESRPRRPVLQKTRRKVVGTRTRR